ncbi:MAG: hypothetical protein NC182_04130 [Prevotella sp.]|nr:hypothetical protein [Staphylococcus sp.]MCM1350369.1 hypothetical protein [Prevotella sp.]
MKLIKKLFVFSMMPVIMAVLCLGAFKADAAKSSTYTNWVLKFNQGGMKEIYNDSQSVSVLSTGFSIQFNYLPGGHMTMGKYSLYKVVNNYLLPVVTNQGLPNEEDPVVFNQTGTFVLRGSSYTLDENQNWVKFGEDCDYRFSVVNPTTEYTNWNVLFTGGTFEIGKDTAPLTAQSSNGFSIYFNYLPGGHMTMGKYSLYKLENGIFEPIVVNQGVPNEEDPIHYDLYGTFLLIGESYQYTFIEEGEEWLKIGNDCNFTFTIEK